MISGGWHGPGVETRSGNFQFRECEVQPLRVLMKSFCFFGWLLLIVPSPWIVDAPNKNQCSVNTIPCTIGNLFGTR